MHEFNQSFSSFCEVASQVIADSIEGINTIESRLEDVLTLLVFSKNSFVTVISKKGHCQETIKAIQHQNLASIVAVLSIPNSELDTFNKRLHDVKGLGDQLMETVSDIKHSIPSEENSLKQFEHLSKSIEELNHSLVQTQTQCQSKLAELRLELTNFQQLIEEPKFEKSPGIQTPSQEAIDAITITYEQIKKDMTQVLQFIDINNQHLHFIFKSNNILTSQLLFIEMAPENELIDRLQGATTLLRHFIERNQNPVTIDIQKTGEIDLF